MAFGLFLLMLASKWENGGIDRRPFGGTNPAGTFGAHWGSGYSGWGYNTPGVTSSQTETVLSTPLTYGGGSFGGVTTIQGSGSVQRITMGPRPSSPTGSQLSGSGTPSNTYGGNQPVDPGSAKRQQRGGAFHI